MSRLIKKIPNETIDLYGRRFSPPAAGENLKSGFCESQTDFPLSYV
ncbi:MAG: hypothetical protein NC078_00805 [Ruminococcus sp.]|nr:hypothetical protein [Ruminococcus sp.]